MTLQQKSTLFLVLLATGLQAGLQFFMSLGELPALRREPLPVFVAHWQAVDRLMAVRMPVVANLMLLCYLLAIVSSFSQRRSVFFVVLVTCFLLSLGEVVLTVTRQLPVNKAIQALDASHLTDGTGVEQLREATLAHFTVRGVLSLTAFAALLVTAVLTQIPGPAAPVPARTPALGQTVK